MILNKKVMSDKKAKRIMQRNIKPIKCIHTKENKNTTNIFHNNIILLFTLMIILFFPKACNIDNIKNNKIINTNNISIVTQERKVTYKSSRGANRMLLMHDIKMNKLKNNPNEYDLINNSLGNNIINVNNKSLIRYDLPNRYYGNIDFSSFQPFMCFSTITNRNSKAWNIVNGNNAYTDENGFRRYRINKEKLTINNNDDYIIALGTYYKKKGIVGNRYVIVTSTGMYTAITGDEKSDNHTDSKHMFTIHNKNKAGLIEWIVDQKTGKLPRSITQSGSVASGPIKELKGEIKYIYRIE